MARRQALREFRSEIESGIPWLALTVLLGLSFWSGSGRFGKIGGERILPLDESEQLVCLPFDRDARGAFAGGVFALLFACGAALLRREPESRAVVVDIAAWYWHFMTVLWVYIFVC